MQPSPKKHPGFSKQMKQMLSSNIYPAYEENTNISEKLWTHCKEVTENRAVSDD